MVTQKILVVDDEADLRHLIVEELQDHNFDVVGVGDGVQAILQVLDKTFSLMLLDIDLPRLNGLDVLRIARKADPGLPVITFTGKVGQGEMATSVQLGAIACLSKPLRLAELVDVVKKFSRELKTA